MNLQKKTTDAKPEGSSTKTTETVRKSLEDDVKSAKAASESQSESFRSYMSGRFKVD